tara:strand:+ start:349 stop:1590 length:1242 start_codon:yes stop_codon:yes gene_type:complete
MIKTLVIAPVLTRSGYGEHGRFIVDALSTRSDLFDLYVHPLHWGSSSWINTKDQKVPYYESLCAKREMYKGQYDLCIQVTIPNEWEKVGKCNIGITAGVETDRIPDSWVHKSNMMDGIIFTSEHAQAGFLNKLYKQQNVSGDNVIENKGISVDNTVVGYPVKDIVPCDLSDEIVLSTDYNFLTITQLAPRKNVEMLLKSFVETFKDKSVGLVCKMHHMNNSRPDWEKINNNLFNQIRSIQKKCKIYWIHGAMSESEIHGLYLHPQINSYISTTHGEGFGLPLFEAAYSGLPIAVTGWSGHLDFLRMTNDKGKKHDMYEKISYDLGNLQDAAKMGDILTSDMKWAFPREKSLIKVMKNMISAKVAKESVAKKLQTHLLDSFSKDKQYSKIVSSCLSFYEKNDQWNNAKNEITEI